jgi:hypothetical protein
LNPSGRSIGVLVSHFAGASFFFADFFIAFLAGDIFDALRFGVIGFHVDYCLLRPLGQIQ